eukprot:gene16469-18106_t
MGSYLVSYRVLKRYMLNFLHERMPLHVFHMIYIRKKSGDGYSEHLKDFTYNKFKNFWYCYLSLLDIDIAKGFQCEICKEQPSSLIMDATSLSFRKELSLWKSFLQDVQNADSGDVIPRCRYLFILDINDENLTLNEVALAKITLKNGKHPGPDNIPPEVLTKCAFDDIILNLANKLLKGSLKPDQWSETDILPLPKSGDLSDTSNYRGISFSSMVAKLVNKMILNRIQSKLDTHLRPNQNGFRRGHSTSSQTLGLRRIIEGVKSRNKKANIVYADFKKAFDSIERRKMLEIFKAYAVSTNLRKAIARFYENTKARVITPDGKTEFFYVKKGVLQGDTLAPYLFVIVVDYLLRMTYKDRDNELAIELEPRKSRRHPAINITDLDYTDDLGTFIRTNGTSTGIRASSGN